MGIKYPNKMDNDLPPPNPLDARKERRAQRSIRLPVSLWGRLDSLAKTAGARTNDLVEQAIRFYFQALDHKNNRKK